MQHSLTVTEENSLHARKYVGLVEGKEYASRSRLKQKGKKQ